MTIAHELQHAIQHGTNKKLWAINTIINELESEVFAALKLTWADIPIEREARIISKRAAIQLLGEDKLAEYIEERIVRDRINEGDWRFIRTLTPESSVDVSIATRALLERLNGYHSQLKEALQRWKLRNPADFGDVEFRDFL